MDNKYFTTSEVAATLGVPYWRIVYAYQSGKVPEPTLRIGNRRVYQRDDVARLVEHFQINPQTMGRNEND